MDDEDIFKELHPNVPWSQLSLQIKELMQKARQAGWDDSAKIRKEAHCPKHGWACDHCGSCIEEARADERAKFQCTLCKMHNYVCICNKCALNTIKEREKEAYAKGVADTLARRPSIEMAFYKQLASQIKDKYRKEGQADLIYNLRQNLELCGWKETDSPVKETQLNDYRRGQVDVFRWLKRESEKEGNNE